MAIRIGRNVKKYPKYLRSMHDIITSNYEAYKKHYDEQRFEKTSKPELVITSKKYCTVIPNCSKDVIKEGTDLNHCVGSYIDKIIEQRTYIFFLRETKYKDKSLVTLELVKGEIVNAKGSYNRKLSEDEENYLKTYCKKMNIGYNV